MAEDSRQNTVEIRKLAAAQSKKKWPWPLPVWTGLGGVVVGALLFSAIAGLTNAASSATTETFLPTLTACGLTDDSDSQIGDDGDSLTLNGKGNDDATGVSIDDFNCIMTGLGTPDSVVSHVGQTTSVDGRQTETWGNLSMSWSYHPDRGADVVFSVVK
jgi:hypothetical protein